MATDYPVTMAIRVLRQHGVSFTPHLYTWEARVARALRRSISVSMNTGS